MRKIYLKDIFGWTYRAKSLEPRSRRQRRRSNRIGKDGLRAWERAELRAAA